MALCLRPIALAVLAAFLIFSTAPLRPALGQAAQPVFSTPVYAQRNLLPAIRKCLASNWEVLLHDNRVDCMHYRAGTAAIGTGNSAVPLSLTFRKYCPQNQPPSANPAKAEKLPFSGRVLTSEIISDLATEKLGSQGIRILGAVFCEPLSLVGLDLQFSLILDHSLFKQGIELRNLKIGGDLSFDGSLIFRRLRILRSQISGSVFGDKSFIENLAMSNTSVEGSVSFSESVLYHSTQFDSVWVARELNVRASALSYFITQFSKISGLLDLSHSEARCAYHINKSDIGFLVAKRAGFGTIDRFQEKPPVPSSEILYSYNWIDRFTDSTQAILQSREVKEKIDSESEKCINEFKRPCVAEFFIFDSNIASSLCISEFEWLAPRDGGIFAPREFLDVDSSNKTGTESAFDIDELIHTVIAINGNTIGNNFIIDLWSNDKNNIHNKVSNRLHVFEAIGVKAKALIVDFEDNSRRYTTLVDGLEFNRIHDAHATCEYGGSKEKEIPVQGNRKLSIISDFTETLKLPEINSVFEWLDLNESGSTQPYTAFATAFQAAGIDSTRIKVARANRELCEQASNWLLPLVKNWCPDVAKRRQKVAGQQPQPANSQSGWNRLGTTSFDLIETLSDAAQLIFRGGLWLIADHGYRPGKVLWWVTVTLIIYWLVFMLCWRVVLFIPKREAEADKGATAATGSADHAAPPGQTEETPPQGTSPESTPENSEQTKDANGRDFDLDDLRKINPLFLFDRLIPTYRISEKNYDIRKYFKWVPFKEGNAGRPGVFAHQAYFWCYFEEVTDKTERRRIERALRILRLLGVIYTIFLAAAVSALIVH